MPYRNTKAETKPAAEPTAEPEEIEAISKIVTPSLAVAIIEYVRSKTELEITHAEYDTEKAVIAASFKDASGIRYSITFGVEKKKTADNEVSGGVEEE